MDARTQPPSETPPAGRALPLMDAPPLAVDNEPIAPVHVPVTPDPAAMAAGVWTGRSVGLIALVAALAVVAIAVLS